MKFEKKESSPCVMALAVTTEGDEAKVVYRKVLGEYLRNAVVPGFRKGKVPQAVVLQKFADELKADSQQAMFREFYPKALEESGIKAIELQNVTDVSYLNDTFKFTALIEVDPQFDLPKYKKLAIKKTDPAVTDEQVADRLEMLRKAYAKYEDAAEGDEARQGDFVQIGYTGRTDDRAKQPLSEIAPGEKIVSGMDEHWTQIEEGRFVPEILEALKGMKVGETKEVKVKFAKEGTPVEALKGKKAVYTVTLKKIRHQNLPDDEQLVKDAKAESLDAMKKVFREQMEKEAEQAEKDSRTNQAIELLLKKADFEVPLSLKNRQMQHFLEELAQRAQHLGLKADYFEKNREQIMKDAEEKAVQQVRISYILKGIAAEEKIEVGDDEIKAALEKFVAESNGQTTVDEMFEGLTNSGNKEGYAEQLRAEKALDFVIAQSK